MLLIRRPGCLRRSLPVLLVGLAACTGEGEPAEQAGVPRPHATWSIEAARVVFSANRGGPPDLYVLDRAEGTESRLTRFASPEGGANSPRLSVDGSRLAFQVRRGTDYEIHLMDLATRETRNLTRHPEYDVLPVWSPDGGHLAFMSTRGFELGSIGPFPGHIYVVDLSSDSLRRVTTEPLTSSLGPSDWSPDRGMLLLARMVDDRAVVLALDLATGSERRLSGPDASTSRYSAVFSHTGDMIAFHEESDDGARIVTMRVDGGDRRVLTPGAGWRYDPRWSPDDAWILFSASDDGTQYDLRAVRVVDGRILDLVATPEDEREGDWWYP